MLLKKVSFSYGNLRVAQLKNSKNRFIFIGSRSCPNQTKLDIEYPLCNYSLKRRNFCYSLRRKKFGIPYGNLRLFRINCDYWILKIVPFHRFKELSKSNQTRYGVSPMYLETKKICHWLPRKKMWFSYGNLRISPFVNFKKRFFHRIKELSKSNQTWYGVSPMYLESKTKSIFAIACVAKKLALLTEICNYFEWIAVIEF